MLRFHNLTLRLGAVRSRSRGFESFELGFTLIELLVAIAIIAILASVLLPTLTSARVKGRNIGCINHLKQLAICAQMYAADNDGKLVQNIQVSGNTSAGTNLWVLGDLKNTKDATNASLIRFGKLYPYASQVLIYRCPSDLSQTFGAAHVRSYSMNAWMGSRYMETLNQGTRYRTFVKDGEVAAAGASRLWIMADEDDGTIDDGWFLVTMDDSRPFASAPGDRHGKGYALAFADGHSETFKVSSDLAAYRTTGKPNTGPDWLRLKQVTTVQWNTQGK